MGFVRNGNSPLHDTCPKSVYASESVARWTRSSGEKDLPFIPQKKEIEDKVTERLTKKNGFHSTCDAVEESSPF